MPARKPKPCPAEKQAQAEARAQGHVRRDVATDAPSILSRIGRPAHRGGNGRKQHDQAKPYEAK